MNESSPSVVTAVAETAPTATGAAPQATAQPPVAKRSGEFRWYMYGYGAFFAGMGINQVLFQYLILKVLGEPPDRFSIAQTLGLIPMLVLVMFGGAMADRSELRGLLVRLQILSAIPAAVLAAIIGLGMLSYEVMIAFTVVLACILAFASPARDSLLTNVAERTPGIEIPRAVSIATLVQFGSQLVGFLLVGAADQIGSVPLLVTFSACHCIAALCTLRVAPTDSHPKRMAPRVRLITQFAEGFVEVWRSERLRVITICMFLMGIFGMGGMMVILPLIIRDIYHGGSFELAAFIFFFQGGNTTTALILSMMRPIKRQGRLMILGLTGGITAMITIHFHPPLYVLFPLVFFWGMGGGIWMNLSRAIIQEAAPPTHRARILSVFALGMLGGGPIGALVAGQLADMWGPLNAILYPPAGFVLICACMLAFTRMWTMERPQRA